MTGVEANDITIHGVQRTNVGPIVSSGDIEIFPEGVIGGPVSDEFHDAIDFSKKFIETVPDEG